MAAFASGADWSFDNLPGNWQKDARTPSESQEPSDATSPQDEAQQKRENTSEQRNSWPPRQCRICLEVVQPTFDINEDSLLPASLRAAPKVKYVSDDGGRLLRPCKCKGTSKYVHEECLNAWRLADPLRKRNYWQCPTCQYRYRLQRLTYASYISSTASQIGLTVFILLATMFLLGFVADPIINLYLDPVYTITTAGGPTGSLFFEDEPASWTEHFAKGLASLGLLGFAKFLIGLNPFNLINIRTGGFGGGVARGGVGGTGRDRISQIGWIAILVGVVTFLIAVWKAVRAWARRTLQSARERVLDVPGADDEELQNEDEQ